MWRKSKREKRSRRVREEREKSGSGDPIVKWVTRERGSEGKGERRKVNLR